MSRAGFPSLAGTALAPVLTSCYGAEETMPTGYGSRHRALVACAIHLTVAGVAEARVGDVRFVHRPGTLVATAQGCPLHERVLQSWHVRFLLITGPWAEHLNTVLATDGGVRCLDRAPRQARDSLTTVVDQVIAQGPGWDWQASAALARVVGTLAGPVAGNDGDLLAQVGRLVDAAPERLWGLAALSRSLHIPPRTLQLRFRQRTGGGPARWVLARRLAHARPLLGRGMPVQAVAERLGFANPFHFSRAYRRIIGVPPSHEGG